jgi:Fur family ferric uptake transcriptional regulator
MARSNSNHFEELLEKHHLKKTGPRLRVLQMLSAKKVATSQPDLESVMNDIDRVTLYRILNAFEEKGIIHKVFDLNGTANYAMCSSDCGENHHHDEHLHFNCTSCNNVYCLDNLHLPDIHLPAGFKSEGFTLYASGLCPICNKAIEKKNAETINA